MLADLTPLIPNRSLTAEEIRAAAQELLSTTVADEPKADFLRAWATRGETAEELATLAETFLPLAQNPGVRGTWNGKPLLDCCGTGGGGLNLVNFSTCLMFVLAAIGIPVVKHGNRGVTKRSGSADVLEALGIRIDLPPGEVPRCLYEIGCAFFFAPGYHTSFAAVASVRRTLAAQGQRTVFNLLGPLLNPARPDARLVGVFKTAHLDLYQHALEKMKCPHFTVAYGEDAHSGKPIGEVSAQGITHFRSSLPDLKTLSAELPVLQALETLHVADASDSARRIEALLSGKEKGFALRTLALNAAVAAWTHGVAANMNEGLQLGLDAINSGRALDVLRRWQKFSQG